MSYKGLRFLAFTAGSRHMGVFPEQAAHWDWMRARLLERHPGARLTQTAAGAEPVWLYRAGHPGGRPGRGQVTHVDASKKVDRCWRVKTRSSPGWKTARSAGWWMMPSNSCGAKCGAARNTTASCSTRPNLAAARRARCGSSSNCCPTCWNDCRQLLEAQPLFVVLTAYAIRASALSIYYAMQDMIAGLGGRLETGELALMEKSAGRLLSTAIFARWGANNRRSKI